MLRVDVDLNSRDWAGLVRAGFEDADGPIGVGQEVLAWQSDDELVADAIVERVDETRRLLFLRVKWDSLRDDDQTPFKITFRAFGQSEPSFPSLASVNLLAFAPAPSWARKASLR